MTPRLCVHIGLPKTASTTLQRALFANHSQIEFLGKRSEGRADPAHGRCASDAAFRLANQLFWEHVQAIELVESRRVWAEEILPALDPNRLPLFSFEGLAVAELDVRKAIARNLRDVFEGCRVLVGIRQPTDMVEALYFQRLKRRHIGSRSRAFDRPRSPSTEAWLDSIVAGDAFAPHLDYARTIRIFVDALGRTNVAVFALEEVKADPGRAATDLCKFLEINVEEGVRLLARHQHNVRPNQAVADRMLRFERRDLASAIYALAGRGLRKRILGFDRPDDSARARLPISPVTRAAIEEKTRDGNRWIAQEFGLPLSDYGYPV